ncbi:MAG: hypothetical protein QNJ30_17920 [Kiloniellales bacterium]|nr:hypothetical protein [Kiloniellales bacterium]
MKRRLGTYGSLLLAALILAGPPEEPVVAEEAGASAPPPKTAKERQAGKAFDPQRVNDCKVPLELRADKTRSADCGEKAKAAEKQGEAAAAEESSD